MLSFNNIITSRAEEDHVKLKRALKTFIEDLKKVINVIELLLKNERSKYLLAHENAKTRTSINCSIYALKHLQTFISSYVLKLIRKQLDKSLKADNNVEILSFCTENYQQSMRLSCAHLINEKAERDEMLQLEDVHSP
jgi:Na+/phosphate symporter